jgi:hypothetical protein
MTHRKLLIFLLLVFIYPGFILNSYAQIDDLVERYAGENAEGYLQPLVTAFGANLNSGLYRSANVPRMGLHINLAINGMVSFYSDDQKTFQATTTGYFYPVQTIEAPTVAGDPQGVYVSSPSGTEYAFPGGFDMNGFIIGTPTLTVGSILGTEGSIRYFKVRLNEDVGDLSLFGIGGRHSISQYIPLSPVDIAVGIFYHKFKISDIVESNSLCYHAEVGKSFTMINLYGGLAYESNKAKVHYVFMGPIESEEVNIDFKGKNKFRFTAGLGFNLTLLHVNVDYSLGYQQVLNAGISVGL